MHIEKLPKKAYIENVMRTVPLLLKPFALVLLHLTYKRYQRNVDEVNNFSVSTDELDKLVALLDEIHNKSKNVDSRL